jgi:hypothetical protein
MTWCHVLLVVAAKSLVKVIVLNVLAMDGEDDAMAWIVPRLIIAA